MSGDGCAGHPPEMPTRAAQITQGARRWGGARATCVGARGRRQSPQREEGARAGLADMTALTKPQGARVRKAQVRPLALWTAQGGAGAHAGLRAIVRRHPLRAEERAAVRADQPRTLEQGVAKKNAERAAHPRAPVAVALRECHQQLARLHSATGLTGEGEERT